MHFRAFQHFSVEPNAIVCSCSAWHNISVHLVWNRMQHRVHFSAKKNIALAESSCCGEGIDQCCQGAGTLGYSLPLLLLPSHAMQYLFLYIQYHAMQYSVLYVQYHAMQYRPLQYLAMQYQAMQCHAISGTLGYSLPLQQPCNT